MTSGALFGLALIGFVLYEVFKGQSGDSVGPCPSGWGYNMAGQCVNPATGLPYETNFGITVTGTPPVPPGLCPGTPGCPGYVTPVPVSPLTGLSGWSV